MREITALAEGLLETAAACARARLAAEWGEDWDGERPGRFVVLGMGKLGGGELNYSSDVDLVYVYERDGADAHGRTNREFFARLAEEVTRALRDVTPDGFCFRVDLRLRPGGGEGPLAVSLGAALSYYEAFGQTWERAAWLKARPVGGDRQLGAALLDALVPFVQRRYLDFGTIEDLQVMKRRVDASLRDPGARARDVKLGRGGIREVEFVVQAQQLVHGGKDPRVQARSTLGALARLSSCGYVDPEQAAALAVAYRFLRDVEHKLQIVHERQTHLVPRDEAEVAALARRLGFRGPEAVAQFWATHARHTAVVHEAFAALFHGPAEERRRERDPEIDALLEGLDDVEATHARLERLGFADPPAARRELRLLREGPPHAPASPRRRAALAALAPALLVELARSATPDHALHHLATFFSTVGARTSYLHLLLENLEVMRLLVRLFATSEFLSQFFLRHPELLDSLVRADLVQIVRSRAGMVEELDARLAAASDLETELDTLRRFRHEEFLRIGVHDIQGKLEPDEVAAQLTSLAETCVGAALALARREVLVRSGAPGGPAAEGLAVLGMGTLGAGELGYNSDLDLIFVYDTGEAAWWSGRTTPHEFFTRIAQRTISALQTPTREGLAYRIDTRLRPSGNQGSLVCSAEAFEAYHRTSAQLWERQALIRARLVAGPPALAARLEEIRTRFVYGRGLDAAERLEMVRMRERIERERGSGRGELGDIKTGRGGLVDIEFLVQMLQLAHGHDHPAVRVRDTRGALAALAAEGILSDDEARALGGGYAFLRAVASRLRLERDQPGEALDAEPGKLVPLARRLGYAGSDDEAVAALLEDHARHRDTVRAVYDRRLATPRT
ncbi:MAG: bifunctional [glutamate--ammonia ligase]-adenylyl-L-tyrosine phosphorylase/[glutamate--ammonia-ligase] adenylyltransferase [Deltaproteobacteria bacterium]|nr:MAG: bifunctional [glutamate--ammonia ligase]-adenylyl-L-tyrosine phosphorylase/[glutamate--ammonia-ligase] adenylyltransferase [Deltaproteobacteria bacterium]